MKNQDIAFLAIDYRGFSPFWHVFGFSILVVLTAKENSPLLAGPAF